LRKILVVSALAASALVAAGCSSSSSTTSPPATHSATPTATPTILTGTEIIAGDTASTANTPVIPLKAYGLFTDTGNFKLSGSARTGTDILPLAKGGIRVYHAQVGSGGSILDAKTCQAKFTEGGTFKVVPGSTGAYKGITGSGNYLVTFQGTMPRLKSGKCNTSDSATPVSGTALTIFKVTGTFTLPAA
jgi:hypothetical protein